MILYLKRYEYSSTGIFGTLENDDKTLFLSTLEHAFEVKENQVSTSTAYMPIVQPGQYTVVLGTHQLDHGGPKQLYCIQGVVDVKGNSHSGICFHIGNYNKDTDACVLLGMARLNDMITMSEKAFDLFMAYMKDVDSFQLIVS